MVEELSGSEGDGSDSEFPELSENLKERSAKKPANAKARRRSEKANKGQITDKHQGGNRNTWSSLKKGCTTPGGVKKRKKAASKFPKRVSKPVVNSGVEGLADQEFLGYDPIAAHHAEPEIEDAPISKRRRR